MTTRRSALAAMIVTCGAWAPSGAAAQSIPRIAGAGRELRKGLNGNELYALEPAALAATVEGCKALGARWVRFDFDWSVMLRHDGTYKPAALKCADFANDGVSR